MKRFTMSPWWCPSPATSAPEGGESRRGKMSQDPIIAVFRLSLGLRSPFLDLPPRFLRHSTPHECVDTAGLLEIFFMPTVLSRSRPLALPAFCSTSPRPPVPAHRCSDSFEGSDIFPRRVNLDQNITCASRIFWI